MTGTGVSVAFWVEPEEGGMAGAGVEGGRRSSRMERMRRMNLIPSTVGR
eukprot:CAMPEP_0169464048 /NCGR_PEP_ID=MMETSP1042-20121227/20442_1 /TAXON_ID=464988 /ORGANISM="Hemiselmis andersenii, Strain CCMP1180" /LENGTH=48 /DNA_ID= /DNA_START= /DNA_END= /DNA_ORIENTATION=